MRLFVHRTRETGLTCLSADAAAAPQCDAASRAPGPAEYRALCEAAARCSAPIAWAAAERIAALARASGRAGVEAAALEAATQVEMAEIFPAGNARLVADAA